MLVTQVGAVFAAPSLQEETITGTVTALERGTDGDDNTIILVTLEDAEGGSQTVGIDIATAESLGLVTLLEDGTPDCSEEAFSAILDAAPEDGLVVEIPSDALIPVEEEPKHPVGAALALFFSEITDYDTIMDAHEDGTGFGLIAQALWMTNKMEGESDTFLAIIEAKKSGDFSAFTLEDGSTPQNWGQFKKAVLNGDKKNNLGAIMSDKEDKPGNGNGHQNNQNNKDKNKDKDKGNGD
jgi:hypothetical protein